MKQDLGKRRGRFMRNYIIYEIGGAYGEKNTYCFN